MSVTLESVPDVVDRATVAPPVVTLDPVAFLSWTVIVVVEVPLRTIEFDAAVMVDVAADGVTVKFTTSLSTIAEPPTVPVIVAEAATADDVRVAV